MWARRHHPARRATRLRPARRSQAARTASSNSVSAAALPQDDGQRIALRVWGGFCIEGRDGPLLAWSGRAGEIGRQSFVDGRNAYLEGRRNQGAWRGASLQQHIEGDMRRIVSSLCAAVDEDVSIDHAFSDDKICFYPQTSGVGDLF